MAKTPMYDPGASEARSGWLAGLTEACSKISGVLEMETATFEDLPLPELFISNDDRYRVYRAPLGTKLWLSATIKKNGIEITEENDGFTIDYLGGEVVFDPDNRLTDGDFITASGTYVIGDSEKIKDILSDINTLTEKAGTYKGYYDTVNALMAAHPTASDGDYAIVGETESFHVWSGTKWADTVKVTDLTDYYTSSETDNLLADKEDSISAHGTTADSDNYYYGGRKTWQDLFSKVLSTALTGFSTSSDTVVTATDTVLSAFGKLQAQIDGNIHPLKGTGAPTTSTVGVIGQEYINTSNGDVYRCTAIQSGSYTWVQYQDKISGAQGQVVGFDASGRPVAQAAPDTGVTSFNGRKGTVTPANGDYTAAQVGARPDTWTPTASEVGAVPVTRKVNDKALSEDITLTASDVKARPDTWKPTVSDIGAVPATRKVNGKALSEDITLAASDVGALPTSGGTLTGNLEGKYLTGTWLRTTTPGHLTTTPPKIPVLDSNGWLYYRTPQELIGDIGGQARIAGAAFDYDSATKTLTIKEAV